MSWQAWLFVVFAFIGVFVLAVGMGLRTFGSEKSKARARSAIGIGTAAILLGTLILLTGAFTVVGTRQVGIGTSFGRPTGQTYSNGLHWKLPWVNVTEMDAAIQYNSYKRDGNQDNPVKVRLGNNSIADTDVTIRWRIRQDAADQLFVDYKTFDNVRVNLIERNLQVALNEVFQSFDPLATKWATGIPLQTFADSAADKLKAIVGHQAEILDISISKLDYDDQTEAKINSLNEERAKTAQAEQAVKTAEQQRRANEILANQPPPNLNVAIANCLNRSVEKGMDPAGCWPIGSDVLPTIAVPNPRG